LSIKLKELEKSSRLSQNVYSRIYVKEIKNILKTLLHFVFTSFNHKEKVNISKDIQFKVLKDYK